MAQQGCRGGLDDGHGGGHSRDRVGMGMAWWGRGGGDGEGIGGTLWWRRATPFPERCWGCGLWV